MPDSPRYTTFQPGELQLRLQELCPEGALTPSVPMTGTQRIAKHTFSVTFPDNQPGTCHYERRAPRWHFFRYQYTDNVWMPYMTLSESVPGDTTFIERKGQELAAGCFREAIRREQKEYFQRASEPADGSRKRRPEKYHMKADKAKEYAGKYAICARSGETLIIMSSLFETIDRANIEWREQSNPKLVVACCNRLDRCWEIPKYNPLYAEYDLRTAFPISVSP